MAVTPQHAEMVFADLGGDCPCFASMLQKAQSLARKRRLEDREAGAGARKVVAKRIALISDKSGTFAPKTMQGDGKLKLFHDFLNAVRNGYFFVSFILY